jgi:hypothetical protein
MEMTEFARRFEKESGMLRWDFETVVIQESLLLLCLRSWSAVVVVVDYQLGVLKLLSDQASHRAVD